jgi:hypothetical protein
VTIANAHAGNIFSLLFFGASLGASLSGLPLLFVRIGFYLTSIHTNSTMEFSILRTLVCELH